MENFKSVFEAYGGDYDVTIARFMGKESLYMKIFAMLFRDDNLQKLGEALMEGDLENAFVAAHTLKGVSGNLGLAPFYEAVCCMVEPVRNREDRSDYLQMYEKIQEEYLRVEKLWGDLQALE